MYLSDRRLWWAGSQVLIVLGLGAWYAAWLRHEAVAVYGAPDPGLLGVSVVRPALWLGLRLLTLVGLAHVLLAIIRSRSGSERQ